MIKNKISFKAIFTSLLILLFFVSCDNNPFKVELSETVDISLKSFEDDLLVLTEDNLVSQLPVLREKYPKFIPEDYQSSTYQQAIFREISFPLNQKLFEDKLSYAPTADQISKDLVGVLSHYKYYYPESDFKEAYTFISGLSRNMDPVMFDTNSVVIAIDHYFGKDYPVYEQSGVFDYQRQLMQKDYLKVDIARFLALSKFKALKSDASFLETMVYLGRINYFVEAMNPGVEETKLMRFKKEDLEYCQENAQRVWTYFVEKEILYSNDLMTIKKYTEPRPFSNSIEKKSPGRIGVWLGRQIVNEYVKRENVSLQDLMKEEDLLKIFRKAKYRP